MSVRSGVGAVAVLTLVAGVVVAATTSGEDPRLLPASDSATSERTEFVRSANLACPVPPVAEGNSAWVSVAGIPGVEGQSLDGTLEVRGGKTPLRISVPGGSGSAQRFPSGAAVIATGGMAPGAVTATVTHDGLGEGRGLASSPCLALTSNTWLVGGGAAEGQRDRLLLSNPTDSSAVAAVEVFGPEGQIRSPDTRNLPLGPGESEELQLDAMAPDVPVLALHVTTKVGLVAAVVSDDRMEGTIPRGVEYLTSAGEPGTRLVLPGVPEGPGARRLVVFAPGRSGTVAVRALTTGGESVSKDTDAIHVGKHRVTAVDITRLLSGRAAAVEVTSDVPVMAALSAAVGDAASGSDLVWSVPAPPVAEIGAAAGMRSTWDTTVQLTATGSDVRARVNVLPEDAAGAMLEPVAAADQEITVPVGRTVSVVVPAQKSTAYAIVVRRNGGGDLYLGHVQTGGSGLATGYALRELSSRVTLPLTGPEAGSG